MYYLLLPTLETRTAFIAELKARGVQAVFHYIPLHSSPAGLAHGRAHGPLSVTDDASDRLVRMPLWLGLEDVFDDVLAAADAALLAAVG
jgi:dTDP-4-amino-4,6-dideoxygalactose transaminase